MCITAMYLYLPMFAFIGTFYFENGEYTLPLAGVTRLNGTHGVPNCGASRGPSGAASCNATAGASFSGYRVHTADTTVLAQG
jgi:hypothetical protein